jgi:hypothetical protein
MKTRRWGTAAIAAAALALFAASASAALVQLPSVGQVNDDAPAGIDPMKSAGPSAAAGGALTAGQSTEPWAIFEAETLSRSQVFVRSYAGGAWKTRGAGTVGGKSSVSPAFPGSLNFDQGQDAEAPSLDFAGTGRTVPWAAWYEADSDYGGHTQIFAARFDQQQGKWVFAGQARPGAVTSTPSLNIGTERDAEVPSIAGGSVTAGGTPVPWIAFQQQDGGSPGSQQVFVEKALKPTSFNCEGIKPIAKSPSEAPLGGFCWQQVGVRRLDPASGASSTAGDPSLNVDPSRFAVEPDIAFAGTNETVPWVVWSEAGPGHNGASNSMVFAARAVSESSGTDGGFKWEAVGLAGRSPGVGVLDTTGSGGFGPCEETKAALEGCSLNASPTLEAENARVAAGTLNPESPPAPWVAWQEESGGHERVFVARLVSGHFELANGGQPLPTLAAGGNAERPDIAFVGNTPYVTWHEGESTVSGHFTSPDSFSVDSGALGSGAFAGTRSPIAAAASGAFFLFPNLAAGHTQLLAEGYEAGGPPGGGEEKKTPPAAPKIGLKIGKTTIKGLLKSKKLKVTVTADQACAVHLTATARVKGKKKPLTLGTGNVSRAAAGSAVAGLKLGKAARKALAGLSRVKVSVHAAAKTSAGAESTAAAGATLKHG